MSSFPVLPLFTDAFIADTGHLSAQETGAYLMLMMVAWRSPECRLVDDDDRLARWARVDRRTWLRIKPSVMEFWCLENGFWTQKRLSKERDGASKRAEAARENGKQGGRPKSLQNNNARNPAGSAQVSGSKASLATSKDYSEDKPLRNQAPPARRVPDDFEHSIEARKIASDFGYVGDEIDEVLAEFVDYWRPLPNTVKARKTDWPATLRNRLRDIRNRRPKAQQGQARASPPQRPQSAQARALEQARQAHLELTGDDDGNSPFVGDAAEESAGRGYQNGHAGSRYDEPLGGRLRLAPPRSSFPLRSH